MRKSLLTISLALLLGGAAVAVAATQDKPAETQLPMRLAQATPPARPLPPAQGRGPGAQRAPLTNAERATRRAALCDDRADRMAGQLAYLEARLDLTAAQRPAFTRWRDARLAAAQRQARTCATAPVPAGRGAGNADAATRPNPVERMAQAETRLRARLADITAERPALEALYNSLSPEQRQKFTPQGGRGMAGLGGRGMGRGMGRGGMRPRIAMQMRQRILQRGPLMRGPGGRGPGGPGMMPPPGGPGAPPVQ